MFWMQRGRVIEYLILANAFMFMVTVAVPELAIRYLAVTPDRVLQMPWTLVTNMFVHAGVMHLFFNMFFGVLMFGGYLERIIGEREFLRVYFLGGLAAALFYVLLALGFGFPDPSTPAVGASGAVFAVIGALVMLRPNMQIFLYFLFPMPLWVFAGFYVLYSIFAIPTMGGVAVSAHLGGLLAGLYFGLKNKGGGEPEYQYVRYY